MSHFTRIKTQMKDKELVLKTLRDLGFTCEEAENLTVRGFAGPANAGRYQNTAPVQL
jgi:hypothetical protein